MAAEPDHKRLRFTFIRLAEERRLRLEQFEGASLSDGGVTHEKHHAVPPEWFKYCRKVLRKLLQTLEIIIEIDVLREIRRRDRCWF